MGIKRKYIKVRASEVDLAGKPLPQWVAASGGFATLGADGKLEGGQLPGINVLNAPILAATNIDYISSRIIGKNIWRMSTGTYTGIFPSGVSPSSLNGSVLSEIVWDADTSFQELILYIGGTNKRYLRQRIGGTFQGWVAIITTNYANQANGYPLLDGGGMIEYNQLPARLVQKGFFSPVQNADDPTIFNSITNSTHNILEYVINDSMIVGFEKSTDLSTWKSITPSKSISYLYKGNKRLEQLFLATESFRITMNMNAVQGSFKSIHFGVTNAGLGFQIKVEGIKNGTSNYVTIYDNTGSSSILTTWPGDLFLVLDNAINIHPAAVITASYNKIRITLKCINNGNSPNWYLNFLRLYGTYPLIREPITHLDSKLTEEPDGHISFPAGVRAQFFDGRATGLGKDAVSFTDVFEVYSSAPVSQLTNFKLTGNVVTNLPSIFGSGNGAFLTVNRYDISSGYMILGGHIKENGLWICYKKPGSEGFSEWIRLDISSPYGIESLPSNITNFGSLISRLKVGDIKKYNVTSFDDSNLSTVNDSISAPFILEISKVNSDLSYIKLESSYGRFYYVGSIICYGSSYWDITLSENLNDLKNLFWGTKSLYYNDDLAHGQAFEIGNYYAVEGNTISNKPFGVGAFLVETRSAGPSIVRQNLYDIAKNETYTRTVDRSGIMSAWKQLGDLKSIKSIVGVVTKASNGMSEIQIAANRMDNSPYIEDTNDGALIIAALDESPGADSGATLFRRSGDDGLFYKVEANYELADMWAMDRNGGLWWVDPGKNIHYKNAISKNDIANYSELGRIQSTSSYHNWENNDEGYIILAKDGVNNLNCQYLFTGEGVYQREESVLKGEYEDFHPLSHPDYSQDVNILPQRWLNKEAVFEKTVFVPRIDANTSLNVSLDHGIALLGAKGSYSVNGKQRILPSADITIEYDNNWLNLLSNGQTLSNVRLIVEYTQEKKNSSYYYGSGDDTGTHKNPYIKYDTLAYAAQVAGTIEDNNNVPYCNWLPYFNNNREFWDYILSLKLSLISGVSKTITIVFDNNSFTNAYITYSGGGVYVISTIMTPNGVSRDFKIWPEYVGGALKIHCQHTS